MKIVDNGNQIIITSDNNKLSAIIEASASGKTYKAYTTKPYTTDNGEETTIICKRNSKDVAFDKAVKVVKGYEAQIALTTQAKIDAYQQEMEAEEAAQETEQQTTAETATEPSQEWRDELTAFIASKVAEYKADTTGRYDDDVVSGIVRTADTISCKTMVMDTADDVLQYAYDVADSYDKWMRLARNLKDESEAWGMREIAEDVIGHLEAIKHAGEEPDEEQVEDEPFSEEQVAITILAEEMLDLGILSYFPKMPDDAEEYVVVKYLSAADFSTLAEVTHDCTDAANVHTVRFVDELTAHFSYFIDVKEAVIAAQKYAVAEAKRRLAMKEEYLHWLNG